MLLPVLLLTCLKTEPVKLTQSPPILCPDDTPPKLTQGIRDSVLESVSATIGKGWCIPERNFYFRKTQDVARGIIGGILVHVTVLPDGKLGGITGGRIVEVEGYLGQDDPACHASAGVTGRTEIFFRDGGIAYVFRSYGIHNCFNVVTLPRGYAGCVLVRALEPLFGVEKMAARRKRPVSDVKNLCSGPGKLSRSLGISVKHNGYDLTRSPLLLLLPEIMHGEIVCGPRIGITKAAEWNLRFCIAHSPWLSRRVSN